MKGGGRERGFIPLPLLGSKVPEDARACWL